MDQHIGRLDGLLLVIGLIAYIGILIYISHRDPVPKSETASTDQKDKPPKDKTNWWGNLLLVVGGLALLVMGSRWFVDAAVRIADSLGLSELVIGLTIVAAGTSMPEVVTSVIAAIRGERDIAVGNVVGSNILNILAVLGLSGLVAPSGIPVSEAVIGFDLPLVIAVAVACLPIFFTGGTISRWEGGIFLG
ncbi:MAG: hypothetical protein U5J63_00055 [Fodinibius sp.]|nr:hypothetical protein [Fodinibius sp.]